MRLHRCYIGRYRVLHHLLINFTPHQNADVNGSDEGVALDFLVGPNGSGKSTLLQALGELFARLSYDQPGIDFPFMLDYDQQEGENTRRVLIANCDWQEKSDQINGITITVDEGIEIWGERTRKRYLPQRVAVITTGREAEWFDLLAMIGRIASSQTAINRSAINQQDIEDRMLSELPGMIVESTADEAQEGAGSVTLIPADTLPLVTLCALLAEFDESGALNKLENIFAETRITQVCGFTLTFRLNQGVASATDRRRIEELSEIATRAVQTGSDRRLYFDLTTNPKKITSQLFTKLGKAFDIYLFLRRLSSSLTVAERTFQGVDIFVRRGISEQEQQRRRENDRVELPPSLQSLSQFSDGERSFLGRMSLFSMLRDQPSLVMLDEPEVHFNDYWKRQIVLYLHEALREQQSHALITTHSSITLTDVAKEDILVLYRKHTHTEKSANPSINTLAADPSDIMVHVFQAPYATGQHAINRVQAIERKINDQSMGRILPANIENEANNLLNQLGPGYWRYQLRRALYRQTSDAA